METFIHPLTPAPRTAVLEDGPVRRGLWQLGSIRTIPCDPGIRWLERLERFRPHCVAASPNRLLLLTDLKRSGHVGLQSLRHSLVMQFQIGEAWIAEDEREQLWSAFQVPVYEQLCDRAGQVLTFECEARHGMHIGDNQTWVVDRDARLWFAGGQTVINRRRVVHEPTGLYGRVELEGCPCGRPGPRLKVYGSELFWPMPSQALRMVS